MLGRRSFLKVAASAPAVFSTLASVRSWSDGSKEKLPVAAVVTKYSNNTHADVLLGKILEGFDQQGGAGPDLRLVSLYTDQVPKDDLSRDLAKKHDFRIAKTIDEAITLGTDKVQVAGVLSIGEHGDYPFTKDTNQHMYPRRRFFDEIVKAMRRGGKVVPVFNDKHLSYNWHDAKQVYDTAKELKISMMAGSSLPVTWREPPLALPMNCEIESALVIGYGGLEAYGFHALEALQCMIERRTGGESGVKNVQAVQGEEIWTAEQDGRWSRDLFDAALSTTPDVAERDVETQLSKKAAFYLVEYRDGLKATVAMANGVARHFSFAAKLRGQDEPEATWFRLQDEKPFGHFAYLLKAIDAMFQTGTPAYPLERTLLTTGVLDTVMHSLAQKNKRLETPELTIHYRPTDWPFANMQT